MRLEILRRAWEFYGEDLQFNILMEEMAELIVAVMHYRRGRGNAQELFEEIADVVICLRQVEQFLRDEGKWFPVEIFIEEKLKRLETRMK